MSRTDCAGTIQRARVLGNDISAKQLKLDHAQLEITLQSTIVSSRNRVEDFFGTHAPELSELKAKAKPTKADTARLEQLRLQSNAAIEGYLNSLDGACQKYNDGKVDKVRFKKAYQREIRQAVQNEVHRDFFHTGHAFHALMRVYEEWENPEKQS